MTREQVLDISHALFKMSQYREDVKLRSRLARRMFKLKREIAESAANVEASETRPLSKMWVQG